MTYQIDLSFVSICFYEINRDVFDGELDTPYFYVSDFTWFGQYWYEKGKHNIALRYWYKNEDEFFGTLAHEMVHQWQKQNGHKLNHGKRFKKKCKKVEKLLGVKLYDR